MGLRSALRALFGTSRSNPQLPVEIGPNGAVARAELSEGDFRLEVVGESRYQDVLERIVGGRSEDGANYPTMAILLPEPENRYDPNAVQVLIAGLVVGYLSRANARVMHRPLMHFMARHDRAFACRALIKGGWDRGPDDRGHFGVELCLEPADLGVSDDQLRGARDPAFLESVIEFEP
ncbi:hypothetical protein HRbin41_00633 [bacterium HR41]|nr:hypothetical protein HRbin41_00633 [bacterium HR41]